MSSRSDEAVERESVVIIIAWSSINLFENLVWVWKVVIDEQTARLGFAKIRVRSDVSVVNFDISLLLHAVDHHQEQVVNSDLVHVFVLGVVVVLVVIVIISAAFTILAATTWVVPAEPGAMKDRAKPVIDRVAVVVMESQGLVRMAHDP